MTENTSNNSNVAVLTNEEMHLKKFKEYLYQNYEFVNFFRSVVVTKTVGERFIKVLEDNKADNITSKERFRVKNRKFKLIIENDNNKLGQEVIVKDNTIERKEILPVLYYEDFYKVINKIHLEVGHSGVNKTEYAIGIRFALVPRSVIAEYCKLCAICNRTVKQVLQSTIIPIVSQKFWERIQIDLVDMRHKPSTSRGKTFKYISHVICHFTSFNILWPLEKKEAEEVACGLRTMVFAYYGLPSILHSDNGLEFKNALVTNLVNTWSGTCKIVHGKPRCPWVQGKVEQSNGTLQKILSSMMEERNNDTWSEFLPEVQYIMNTNQHSVSKSTPFKMVTGVVHNLGMEGTIDGGDESEVVSSESVNNESSQVVSSQVVSSQVVSSQAVSSESVRSESVRSESLSSQAVANKRKISTDSDSFESEMESSDEEIVDPRNLEAIRQRITKSREKMSTKHNNKRNKKTHEFITGDFVAVIVPREDRGHSDLRRLPGQIIESFLGKIPQYTISTAFGVLIDKYSVRFLTPYEGVVIVDNTKKISLHQAASRASRHTEDASIVQTSCECKSGCNTKTCPCRKLNKDCTTHCHLKLFKKKVCSNKLN